jgi:hypothetical protein
MDRRGPPEERLASFEAWLRKQLAERLEWPTNPALAQKQIGQCQRFVNGFLCDLHRRGWLFDGPLLAEIITSKLDDVAKRQKTGAVDDLWIYMRVVWKNYADAASEKLHSQAMSAGFHISKIMGSLKTIPQATAERMEQISADRLTAERKRLAKERLEADQGSLF